MNLTFISDTHTLHDKLKLGNGDVLIHCGDFTNAGSIVDVEPFALFMSKTNYKYKIVIAGNHDFAFENKNKSIAEQILKDHGIIYLNDSGITIEGIKFWGSPVQPEFFDWAFNRKRGADIKRHWDLIPNDTDVLITHGPPYEILDRCRNGAIVGCQDLLDAVTRVQPKIHAFGHIHEAYGQIIREATTFINASNLDERYRFKNSSITLDI